MNDLLLKNNINLNQAALEKEFGCEVVLFDGVRGKGLFEIVEKGQRNALIRGEAVAAVDGRAGRTVVQDHLQNVVHKTLGNQKLGLCDDDRTAKIDQVLLHPFFGLLLFFLIMTFIFSSIFWFAKPFMDGIDHFMTMLGTIIQQAGSGSIWADFSIWWGCRQFFGCFSFCAPNIYFIFGDRSFGINRLFGTRGHLD